MRWWRLHRQLLMISSTSFEWSHLHSQTFQSMDRPDPAYSPSQISKYAETQWSQGKTPFISKRGKKQPYSSVLYHSCDSAPITVGTPECLSVGIHLKRGFPARIWMSRRTRMVLKLLFAWIVTVRQHTKKYAEGLCLYVNCRWRNDYTVCEQLTWRAMKLLSVSTRPFYPPEGGNPLWCVRCYCLRPFQGKRQSCSRDAIFRLIHPLQSASPETSNIILWDFSPLCLE